MKTETTRRYAMSEEEAAAKLIKNHNITDTRKMRISRGTYDTLDIRFSDDHSYTTLNFSQKELKKLLFEKYQGLEETCKEYKNSFMVLTDVVLYVYDQKKSWLGRLFS